MSSVSIGLFMRLFCCYLIILLIALQSINVIAANSISHQEHHQNTYSSNHQDSDHHSEIELLFIAEKALNDGASHSEADHPDCHANHCHHSNLVYLDLSTQLYLFKPLEKQLFNKTVLFNSLLITPFSRPPIV